MAGFAQSLSGAAEFLQKRLDELDGQVGEMLGGWQGGAGGAYASIWQRWHRGAIEVESALSALAKLVGQAGAEYGRNEAASAAAMAKTSTCGRELMPPLTVDPAALNGAGVSVIAVGSSLAGTITALTTALAGSSGMAGDDPAGAEIGHCYDSSASKLFEAMAATRNGRSRLGDGVRMSAHNYSLAEAQSDPSGQGGPLPVPPSTAPISAGTPPSSVGTGTSAPPGWGWVAPYIGMIWPTGDSAKLRAAAAAWVTAGTNFGVTEIQGTAGVLGPIRAQHIPEGGAIDAAFTDAYPNTTRIVETCRNIANQLNAYADNVDKVHKAILDLLGRICNPLTGLKEVLDILTDEDEDEIKKIADDIRTVVNHFTSEVEALGREIGKALTDAENVVTAMGKYARRPCHLLTPDCSCA